MLADLLPVLLALAAVVTAWCSYQATRWNGEQAKAFSRANAARIESTRASSRADAETQVDVATFTQWVNAYAQDETELADFYYKRFRPEFEPAVEAWVATRPLRNQDAPLTPFAMPEYQVAARAEAAQATAMMERLLRIASPLGLYAEEYEVERARHLGNFPQAFSHLALIEAAARIILLERLRELS